MAGAGVDIGVDVLQVKWDVTGDMGAINDGENTQFPGFGTNLPYREGQRSLAGDLR